MPQMLFYGITALATAMLNAQRRFVAAAFAPMLNNVVVIAVFLMLPRVASESLSVHSVLDDDLLVLLMGARHDRGRRGDGARAASCAPTRARAICASFPRGATPPCARWCGVGAGPSGT